MDIRDLLAFGEPAHDEPAYGRRRNTLFEELAGQGVRSIALETDRVAALIVDDFVQEGVGTLDEVLKEGFSHSFGTLEPNRELVAWMREYNNGRPAGERLAFHGFDASTEMMSAPSPRTYLEHTRDYLGLDLDIARLAGDDERWSRGEAVLDPAVSVGDTAEAHRLRALADDLLTELHLRAPELIAATSRAAWFRAKTHVTAGLGLLRYHRESAQPGDQRTRMCRQCGTRDVIMAQNLLDIREVEAGRGATMVFANNSHLQLDISTWRSPMVDFEWWSAGAIVASLVGERYSFAAGRMEDGEVVFG